MKQAKNSLNPLNNTKLAIKPRTKTANGRKTFDFDRFFLAGIVGGFSKKKVVKNHRDTLVTARK